MNVPILGIGVLVCSPQKEEEKMNVASAYGAYAQRQYSPDLVSRKEKQEVKATPSRATRKDRVEISSEGMSRLDIIRAKVAKGFYSTDAVADDITEKLGRVINEFEF